MKIVIGYPPIESNKGIAQLSQNRQFQWTAPGPMTYFIYPVVPAYAASLLKKNGYDVFWLDGLAEKWTYNQWLTEIKKIRPDIIFIETKTPVIKYHWSIINDLKKLAVFNWQLSVVLAGDHVTALPEESMEKCAVDFVITGGDFDFGLLSIANHLSKGEKLEPGIWYRDENLKPKTKNYHCSGVFKLNHSLDELPVIDRELTKWHLYAYKNSNFFRAPGAYTMFGRDCWWGKCTFCISGDTQILTRDGLVSIEKIVEEKQNCEVLTAESQYRKVIDWHKRFIDEKIKTISAMYLPYELKITSNHKVYFISKDSLTRCSQKGANSYECRPSRVSSFLDCEKCSKKYHMNYQITTTEAENLKKGDFLAIPIDRTIKEIKQISVEKVLKSKPTILKTQKRIPNDIIEKIIKLDIQGKSERGISALVNVDRETVHRYLLLNTSSTVDTSINHLSFNDNDEISFIGGHHKVPRNIQIENNFLFVAGLFIAEGHVSYCKNRPNSANLGFTFNKNEIHLINETKKYFKKTFNITLGNTINNINNTCQLYVGSTILCSFFKTLFGNNCYEKRIPDELLHLPLDQQRLLLSGIFEGDGHLRKHRRNHGGGPEYILETTSKLLADQVFALLLRFNAIPSFKSINPRLKNESIKYKITLFQKDINFVFPDIEINNNSKITYKKGFIINDFALVPIVKIVEKQFKGYVYNLTVEENHSYTANFVSVKNCSWTTLFPGAKFRSISIKNALREIDNLVGNYKVKEIMDDSGSFPVGNWTREFCTELIKRKYPQKVRINCNMRFNSSLTQNDYYLMKKAGFRFILYGLESASQKTLDRIDKNLKVEQIESCLRMAKKAGLSPHVTVMVGYPWETEKDTENTIFLVKDLFKKGLVDTMQATIVIPYPGTPLFKQCKENGWLKTTDWNRYDMREPVMKAKIPDGVLLKSVRSLYSYSIWNKTFILNTISKLQTLDGFKYVAFQGLKYFGKLFEFK